MRNPDAISSTLLGMLKEPPPQQQQQPQQAGQSAKSPLGQLVADLRRIMEESKKLRADRLKQLQSTAGAPALQKIGQYVKYATLIRLREELTKMRGMEKRASARNEIDRLIRKIDYGIRIVRRRITG